MLGQQVEAKTDDPPYIGRQTPDANVSVKDGLKAAGQRQIERHRERRDRGVAETGLNVETDPKGFDSVPSSLLPL